MDFVTKWLHKLLSYLLLWILLLNDFVDWCLKNHQHKNNILFDIKSCWWCQGWPYNLSYQNSVTSPGCGLRRVGYCTCFQRFYVEKKEKYVYFYAFFIKRLYRLLSYVLLLPLFKTNLEMNLDFIMWICKWVYIIFPEIDS